MRLAYHDRREPPRAILDDVADLPPLPTGVLVVLYDGVCGLCNSLVRFLLARDHRAQFRFASLQGRLAADILGRHGRQVTPNLDTIYVVESLATGQERLESKSAAVLALARRIGFPWSTLGILRIAPRFIRDFCYDLIARSRYRIWGKHDVCPIPRPEWRDRFLE